MNAYKHALEKHVNFTAKVLNLWELFNAKNVK